MVLKNFKPDGDENCFRRAFYGPTAIDATRIRTSFRAARNDSVQAGNIDLLAVILDSCGAQPGKTVAVNGALPTQELIDCQRITRTGIIQAQ